MNSLLNLLSPAAMHSLGWALLHFLWEGTALAAIAAAAMALCRRPSARYVIGVGALVFMLLAPLVTFFGVPQEVPQEAPQGHSGVADTAKSSPLAAAALPIARGRDAASGSTTAAAGPKALPRFVEGWLVEAWLLGVALFSMRSAGGFFLLERQRRKQSRVVEDRILEICYTLQDRIGLTRAISYFECKWLQAPAVVGWFRPVVFLPMSALTGLSESQLEAVIAHELAHIQRLDAFVNVFQVCVETLLFYHPAVWWLNKRIRAEREHCCDETAVALCGDPVEYARALTLMEEWRSAPVFAMAANRGPLTERIVRVLGLKTLGAGMRGIGLTGSALCLTAALIAGDALIEMARPKSALAAIQIARIETNYVQQHSTASSAAAKPSAGLSQSSATSSSAAQSSAASSSPSSYVDAMKAAGLGDLSVDQLIALKIQDVTPEYVRAMHDLGMHPDANMLIAMRVQDITPDYIRELHDAGLNPDQNHLIALKIQGADGEYYKSLKDAGLNPDVDHLIALKTQDVTPEYVKELRAAGLAMNVDQVIAMKVQDVSPSYLKGLRDQGIEPTAENAIGMRVQDVTPEFIRDIRALGLNPSAGELIAMRVQDVTPEYIKALQASGYKLSIGDIIGAKVQDVTPEFIERVQKHGFKDLTLQKLIQLRQLGILDSKSDI